MTDATDDYLYDLHFANTEGLSLDLLLRQQETHLQKATRYFELKKFEKCLEHIKTAEKHASLINTPADIKGKILAYKAYCKFYLNKFESAKDYFEDLINYLTTNNHYRPCLFITYFYHACCLCALGEEEKAKEKVRKLINMKLVQPYDNNNPQPLRIYDQPCFHPNGVSLSHLFIISQEIAEATGHNILSANHDFYPKHSLCNNTDETLESCLENCVYTSGAATATVFYIKSIHIQVAVTLALVYFQVQCMKCCKSGLKSDDCLRTLKTILKYTLNSEQLDNL
jgi:tetratricopeptide (TPR) repeat protein